MAISLVFVPGPLLKATFPDMLLARTAVSLPPAFFRLPALPCRFEGHADLTASETFLRRQAEKTVRPIARPVRFTWDDLVEDITPSRTSQRTAHGPEYRPSGREYCLRGLSGNLRLPRRRGNPVVHDEEDAISRNVQLPRRPRQYWSTQSACTNTV